MSKYLATVMLTTALLSCAASAQTGSNKAAPDSAAAAHKEGEWRASKLVGVNVYNDSNEKIGDINDVILDKSGKVENVVLGVGGFLGMGEHYVAVAYDKLKWSNEPPRSSGAGNRDVWHKPSSRQQRPHCCGWYGQGHRHGLGADDRKSQGRRLLVSRSCRLQRDEGSAEGDASIQVLIPLFAPDEGVGGASVANTSRRR